MAAELQLLVGGDQAAFEALLQAMMSASNEQRTHAEAVFNELKKASADATVSQLVRSLRHSPDVQSRSLCAVMLRKVRGAAAGARKLQGLSRPALYGRSCARKGGLGCGRVQGAAPAVRGAGALAFVGWVTGCVTTGAIAVISTGRAEGITVEERQAAQRKRPTRGEAPPLPERSAFLRHPPTPPSCSPHPPAQVLTRDDPSLWPSLSDNVKVRQREAEGGAIGPSRVGAVGRAARRNTGPREAARERRKNPTRKKSTQGLRHMGNV